MYTYGEDYYRLSKNYRAKGEQKAMKESSSEERCESYHSPPLAQVS